MLLFLSESARRFWRTRRAGVGRSGRRRRSVGPRRGGGMRADVVPAVRALLGGRSRACACRECPRRGVRVALDPLSGFFLSPRRCSPAGRSVRWSTCESSGDESARPILVLFQSSGGKHGDGIRCQERRPVPHRLGNHGARLLLPGDLRARATICPRGWLTYLVATHLGPRSSWRCSCCSAACRVA